MKTHTISTFNGIFIPIDPTDMKDENCVDCSNVDISTEGQLSSIQGMTKFINTGLNAPINALIQFGDLTTFSIYNGTLGKL
jgi:hypothetical protein